MAGTEVERRPDPIEAMLEKPYYDSIDARMLGVLKAKWTGLKDGEIAQALELARSLRLNPWTNEIWAVKGQGRDGGEGKLLILVGRDGLLRKAEEFPDYTGYDTAVVYEGDTFKRVAPDPEGKTLRERAGVVHEQAGFQDMKKKIIGAWCAAERRGRPPRVFLARLEEYATGKHAKSPWGSTVSVMIEKCAISVVHRTLCNLSGVYIEEEVARMMEGTVPGTAEEVTMQWGDGEVGESLRAAWERSQEVDPTLWPVAKMEMALPGLTDQAREAMTIQITEETEAREKELAAQPKPEAAEESEEPAEEEVDAEPTEDAPPEEEPAAESPPEEQERPFKDVDADKLRNDAEALKAQLEDIIADPEAEPDGDAELELRAQLEPIETELRIRGGEEPGQGSLL